MKMKNLLLGIALLLTFMTFSQSDEKQTNKLSSTKITAFKVNFENPDDIKTFNWTVIDDILQKNDKDQKVKLTFAYTNKSPSNSSEPINFKVELEEETGKLKGISSNIKEIFENLIEN